MDSAPRPGSDLELHQLGTDSTDHKNENVSRCVLFGWEGCPK